METSHWIKRGDVEIKVSTRGGTIETYTVGGKEIFFPWQMIKDGARGGCPISAPWFGVSRRAEKKHGFLRERGAYNGSLFERTACLYFRTQNWPGYPWRMEYKTRAFIGEGGALEMILRIIRKEDGLEDEAPVNPGFNPYFALPKGKTTNDVQVFVGGDLHQGFSRESKVVPLTSHKVTILIPGEIALLMELDGDFFRFGEPQLVFWTDAPEKYFCLKPIFQPPERFDTPRGFFLGENDELKLQMTLDLL